MTEPEVASTATTMLPWNLPWQQQAWQQFQQSFLENKLHHAWIIEGDSNYAVDLFVESVVQLINCQQLENNTPCKHCKNCMQIQNNSYADVYRLHVLDKKTQIGVDQVREVSNAFTKKAYSGGYRVIVVEQAESMNKNSANAFLKTLEEPGEKTLILIQTRYPSRLLPTLRSRCQKLSLTNSSYKSLRNWLLQTHPDKSHSIDEALIAASYQPLLAIEFLKNDSLQHRNDSFQRLDQLLSGKIKLLKFEQSNTVDPEQLFSWLEQYMLKNARQRNAFGNKLNEFYNIFADCRLQSIYAREADKPLLIREILIKWIALSVNISHS